MGKKVIVRGSRTTITPPQTLLALPPAIGPSPTSVKQISTWSAPVGIQTYLDSIMGSLKAGEPMVGIWGPGGIGKTTLIQSMYNKLHSDSQLGYSLFDFVIWTVASFGYNPESLQRDIASSLGLKLPFSASCKSYAQAIFDFLEHRSFLLVIDDLWSAVDLGILGIPSPRAVTRPPRRAVVFTTRYKEVCKSMDRSCRVLRLECLDGNDAFALFSEKVGLDTINSDPRIPGIAEEIINEYCQRLPLALTATGTALSSKKTYEEWIIAHKNLKKSSANFPGMGKSFFPLLKLSYDNLDDIDKKCFLSCALWPENYSICKDELVECWMGLGHILEQDVNSAYSRGQEVIRTLSAASLLMPGDVDHEVRMHQTMRGLALWIASNYGENREKWMVTLDSSHNSGSHYFNWSNAERVSLMYNDIEAIPLHTKCEGLTTLILKGNMSLTRLPQGFFARLPALSYMDFSHTGIEELPADIRRLVKLKYLNLSHTKLHSLPMEVEHLKELEYLFLYRTLNLKPLPRKVLLGLSKLRVLDLTASGCGFDLGSSHVRQGSRAYAASADILDLECFCRDQNRKSALCLGITVVSVKALSRLSKLSAISTRRLWLNNLEELQGTLDLLSPNLLGSTSSKMVKSLRELAIMNCDNLEKLVMAGGTREVVEKKTDHRSRLLGLEVFQLLELRSIKEIDWKGGIVEDLLPSLRELTIFKCNLLKNVSWVVKLPSLEYLQLQECAEMEAVVGYEKKVNDGAFPKLKVLVLDELPCLFTICNQILAFPALESLQVLGCPNLKKVPFRPDIRSCQLKKIQGEKLWWENLQWDDKSIKRELLDRFFFIPQRVPIATLPSRRLPPAQGKDSSSGSFYRAVVLPTSLPLLLLSLSTVFSPSVLLICVFLLFIGKWGLLQR